MMPLGQIDALEPFVAADWSCPVADEVAAAWGGEPGAARWWRSSASHVFALPLAGRRCYLRFVPESVRPLEAVARTANLMATLPGVAKPVASLSGELAMEVATTLGPMYATVVEAAPGSEWDADDITPARAVLWGRAHAEVHQAAAGHPWPAEHRFDGAIPDGDPLAPVASALLDALRALPEDEAHFGLIHGDFELDNIAWDGDRPTAFDFDEATRSWYAADVAYALRDVDERPDLVAAFLDGYRTVRPFDALEEQALPLFRRLNAIRSALSIEAILAAASPGAPRDLTVKLQAAVRRQREIAATARG